MYRCTTKVCSTNGKVNISFDKSCKYIVSPSKPKLGFFYDSSKTEVTHRFSINDITDDRGIGKYVDKFLPPWRKELYKIKLEAGRQRTWMLINNIFELLRPQKIEYFGKKIARSLVYTDKGAELEYIENTPSPRRRHIAF